MGAAFTSGRDRSDGEVEMETRGFLLDALTPLCADPRSSGGDDDDDIPLDVSPDDVDIGSTIALVYPRRLCLDRDVKRKY